MFFENYTELHQIKNTFKGREIEGKRESERTIRNSDFRKYKLLSESLIPEGDMSRKNCSCHNLTHCGRVRQICVFNTVKLGTSASSP